MVIFHSYLKLPEGIFQLHHPASSTIPGGELTPNAVVLALRGACARSLQALSLDGMAALEELRWGGRGNGGRSKMLCDNTCHIYIYIQYIYIYTYAYIMSTPD